MAKQCKFLQLCNDEWWRDELELNKWINQGYEVKHMMKLDGFTTQKVCTDTYVYNEKDYGILVYMEKTVDKAPTAADVHYPSRSSSYESSSGEFPF